MKLTKSAGLRGELSIPAEIATLEGKTGKSTGNSRRQIDQP